MPSCATYLLPRELIVSSPTAHLAPGTKKIDSTPRRTAPGMSIRINPLSVAKGHAHTCELCSQPATLLCSTCRVTYYCSASHQQTDRLSIHTRICSLLGALRSLRPTLGSEDERNKRQLTITLSHHALIDLTRAEATKHLTAHNHLLAIPAALQSLRFAVQVYGKSRLELVPSYLLLAEGNLGLGRLKAAEEYLLYAHWAVVQSGERCAEATQAELHRQFGLLYTKQGRLGEAVKSYAHDVYHSSLEYGPEHIETSLGIFHLGSTFLLSHKAGHTNTAGGAEGGASGEGQQEVSSPLDSALAFYDKCIDIWYKFLINLRSSPLTASPPATAPSASSSALPASSSIHDYLTTPQLHTHLSHLTTILTTRSALLSASHIATAEAAYTLGMLKESGGYDVDAEWLYERAERVYERVLGAGHESALGVRRAREEMPRGVRLQKTQRMTDWAIEEDDEDKGTANEAEQGSVGAASDSQQQGKGETNGEDTRSRLRREQEEKEQVHIEPATEDEEVAQAEAEQSGDDHGRALESTRQAEAVEEKADAEAVEEAEGSEQAEDNPDEENGSGEGEEAEAVEESELSTEKEAEEEKEAEQDSDGVEADSAIEKVSSTAESQSEVSMLAIDASSVDK